MQGADSHLLRVRSGYYNVRHFYYFLKIIQILIKNILNDVVLQRKSVFERELSFSSISKLVMHRCAHLF